MTGIPLTRFRPVRESDGRGGFPETFNDAGVTIFGLIDLHDDEENLIVDRNEDVVVSDVVSVADENDVEQQGACYRVTKIHIQPRARRKTCMVERIERPLFPARPRYVLWNGSRILFNGKYVVM